MSFFALSKQTGALHGVAIDGEARKARDAATAAAAAAGDNFGVTFSARPIVKGGGSSTSFLHAANPLDQQGLSNTRFVHRGPAGSGLEMRLI